MARIIITLSILFGLFALLRVGVALVSRTPAIGGIQSSGGNQQLGDCSKKPNCMGSQSSRKNQTVEALAITSNASNAMPILIAVIRELGGEIAQQQGKYLHATFKTPVMGYTDDVELLVDKANNVIQIRSASRLGHSDLGANKKRIDNIRLQLVGRL
ncbi:MAG: DUF1499 domain-containing protein [Granulosicoccaceae bacterium]